MDRRLIIGIIACGLFWLNFFRALFSFGEVNGIISIFVALFWVYIFYITMIREQNISKWMWVPVGFMISIEVLMMVVLISFILYL